MKNLILTAILTSIVFIMNAQCVQHQDLVKKMEKAINEKNVELLAEVYHQDAKRHTPNGLEDGLVQIQEAAKKFYGNVPDGITTYSDVICTEDKIVIRWEGNGTVKEFGKKVKVTGNTIQEIKNGKVIEEWEEINMLSLMMQLGMELKPVEGGGE